MIPACATLPVLTRNAAQSANDRFGTPSMPHLRRATGGKAAALQHSRRRIVMRIKLSQCGLRQRRISSPTCPMPQTVYHRPITTRDDNPATHHGCPQEEHDPMQLQQGKSGAFPGLVLSPLYDDCMLRSQERRETYDAIAGELCDYGLRWQGGDVDARAFRCKTDSLALYSMRYGDEVTITPDTYRDFFLVHLCLKAGIEVETDGVATPVPEGAVFLSAPRRSIRLRWQEGCEQLILRVPYEAAGIAGRRLQRSGVLMPRALSPLLVSQLNTLMALSRQGSGRQEPGG